MAYWKKTMEILLKLIIGMVDPLSKRLDIMESEREARANLVEEKFEELKTQVGRNFARLKAEPISSNTKVSRFDIFVDVQELVF